MATQTPLPLRQRERFFYCAMAVVAALIIFAGFARTYYLKGIFGTPELSPLVHLHGFLFTSWLIVFLVQVTLVAVNRTDIHRRLGVAGGVLATLMLIVGTMTAIHAARRGVTIPNGPPPLVFLVIPVFDLLVFSTLAAAGFYYRRKSQIHKRLMLLATIALLVPAIARLPIGFIRATGPLAFFGLTDLVLLACVSYDTYVHRRLHPAFLWGGLWLIVSQPLRMFLGGTNAWLAFAQWLIR